ncbi:MAG: GNAT family N-acetyltransferase [Verrucomicrobiae bacterium]|nr:GNAT family N-acetyltransferase [Verrucomicrobiae bacterium]
MSTQLKTGRRRTRAQAPAVEIRQMRLDDLPAVFELGQRLFTAAKLPTLYRCWDDDELLQLFNASEDTCFVAVAGDRLVGFALGSIMEKPHSAWRYGWLEWLGVAPAYKRMGVATRLLNKLTDVFIQRDARIMLVDTDEENIEALAFFRRHGFGREKRHVYLSLNLDGHPRNPERRNGQRAA